MPLQACGAILITGQQGLSPLWTPPGQLTALIWPIRTPPGLSPHCSPCTGGHHTSEQGFSKCQLLSCFCGNQASATRGEQETVLPSPTAESHVPRPWGCQSSQALCRWPGPSLPKAWKKLGPGHQCPSRSVPRPAPPTRPFQKPSAMASSARPALGAGGTDLSQVWALPLTALSWWESHTGTPKQEREVHSASGVSAWGHQGQGLGRGRRGAQGKLAGSWCRAAA